MPKVTLEDKSYFLVEGDTILDGLTRRGVRISNSCQVGLCRSCLLKQEAGEVPIEAQKGLRRSLQIQNYFLACLYQPRSDISISFPTEANKFSSAVVVEKTFLNEQVCRLRLKPIEPVEYHSGQHINLRRSLGLVRSYSLASVPSEDSFLELHVKRVENGAMSNWIHDKLKEQDTVEFQGSYGSCFYISGQSKQKMLLIATETGLAPLQGIVREALHQGHTGSIWLYNGNNSLDDFYYTKKLFELSKQFQNFHYIPCLSSENAAVGFESGFVNDIALDKHFDLKGTKVFLAGNVSAVHQAEERALKQGALLQDVFSDPFCHKDS